MPMLAIVVLTSALLMTAAIGATTESTQSIDDRIRFVGKLISDSSASRKVDASENDNAKRLRDEALQYYELAIEAQAAGDLPGASDSLGSAVRSMYAAVGAARKGEKGVNDRGGKYDERIAVIDALMSAHERITEEKGFSDDHEALREAIADDMSAAATFHVDGNAEQANEHVDIAYEKVRHAVEILRQGETLVRELSFADAEEEYVYELDRNDTHQMLISLLIEKQAARPDSKKQVEERVSTALKLRQEAEILAEDGRFDQAITILEQSTNELVKAIRGAGVYIPG
jgi:tetratricopeptide (TPR) repeat protein